MPSPFPGMDPYLEHPAIWPDVHTTLIVAIRDALVPLVRPRYYVAVEVRVFRSDASDLEVAAVADDAVVRHAGLPISNGGGGTLSGPRNSDLFRSDGSDMSAGAPQDPSSRVLTVQLPQTVAVRERYLEVREPETHEVIAVIEILSPTNKRPGEGRRAYEEKRQRIASTRTNLVEVDLLRGGEPLPVLRRGRPLPREELGDYRILVSRGYQWNRADLYTFSIRAPIPEVPIPLREGEPEPNVDTQALMRSVYDRGGFDARIDYRRDPIPPLKPEDAAWADALLREHGLR
ncbi:MAG: DUF4058 family protein [Chloroflexi bacterium]|nr:DUF4058 family protein [Chloroflexota bacterium]